MRDFSNVEARADELKEDGIKQITKEETSMSKKMEKQYTKANKDLEYSAEEINTRVQERAQDAINLASGLTGTIDTSKLEMEQACSFSTKIAN